MSRQSGPPPGFVLVVPAEKTEMASAGLFPAWARDLLLAPPLIRRLGGGSLVLSGLRLAERKMSDHHPSRRLYPWTWLQTLSWFAVSSVLVFASGLASASVRFIKIEGGTGLHNQTC